MEKWRSKRRSPLKANVDFPKNHIISNNIVARPASPVEKKKVRKWRFGNFLRKKSKNASAQIVAQNSTQMIPSVESVDNAIFYTYPVMPQEPQQLEGENIEKNPQIALSSGSHDSMTSPDVNYLRNLEGTMEIAGRNARRNRLKLRIQAKREKYNDANSSSEDEYPSNLSLFRIHSEDSIQISPKYDSYNQKRTRGARTERYMKRLFTNGDNKFPHDQYSIKHQLKCPSDILQPTGSPISDNRANAYRKSLSCTNSYSPMMTPFGSDCHIPNYRPKFIDSTALHDNQIDHNNQKYTLSHYDTSSLANYTNYRGTEVIQPPEPPPRSFKLKLYPSTMRYSLQHSDIDTNNPNEIFTYNKPLYNDFNCNSLDQMYTLPTTLDHQYINTLNKPEENRPLSPEKNVSWARKMEEPIVAQLQPRTVISKNVKNADVKSISRHSKNLEEALAELETIYNSLRLSDEDLLDRAEQRSMDEYRNKIATTAIDGSIKSTSNTSSSTEMTRKLAWRDVCYENDSRLKDDMAYRRMHHNERPASVDNNYGSISRMSYLTSSPCLSYQDTSHNDKPKSRRRGTPDLTRDDVVFRSISHANNTLKIVDPQPPFGIPLGPVTGAAESDYLHVVPHKDEQCRSLYIPKREPDVVTDDLAFRSLRKDATRDRAQSPGNTSFLPKILFVPEVRKKRALRSLSADLYGIINKDSKQSSWYKKYVKLNRPLRVSWILEAPVNELRNENLDINGNKPKKIHYKDKVQVDNDMNSRLRNDRKSVELEIIDKINSEEIISPIQASCGTSDKAISSFTDQQVSELCHELENLIKKTSKKVKITDKVDSPRSSLIEFVEWEKLLSKNKLLNQAQPKGDPLEGNNDDGVMKHDENESNKCLDIQRNEDIKIDGEHEPIDELINEHVDKETNLSNNIKTGFKNTDNSIEPDDKILVASKDNKLNNDCHAGINITSMIEGEIIIGNKCNVGHLLKSIMNVCFVTNCLTAYSVALWSLCLTLLIAIIVAL